MPSIRFRLDAAALGGSTSLSSLGGTSLDGIEETVRARYGPAARVLSTEEVRTGGIGGFFARRFVDVVMDVPEPTQQPQHWTAHRPGSLDDLLERADLLERTGSDDGPLVSAGVPPLSTETNSFTGVLADLQRYASPEPAAETPGPTAPGRVKRPVVLLRAPGDLVVIAGIGGDPLTVATALAVFSAGSPAAEVAVGGVLAGAAGNGSTAGAASGAAPVARISDYRSAFAARARGVDSGQATLVAYGIGAGNSMAAADAAAIASIRPDQVWLAVDASRKPQDTERWVNAMRAIVSVQAIAVLRADFTATPETVLSLGLPEGWSDAVG